VTRLLDVNVLVALAWPNHVHHAAAHRWFAGLVAWAMTPIPELGFVRVSSNASVLSEAVRPGDALDLLARMRRAPGDTFWDDVVVLSEDDSGLAGRIVVHRQLTDAHLILLARSHGGRVATFDRGLVQLVADLVPDTVERIPTEAGKLRGAVSELRSDAD
jgi:toxin-antitoxin system PIN domain toxin